MFFKRLEAIGFKSFATKTVCEFRPGTTVVVGPNGCGKSNIMDAIQWVLGEQSAKSLRGKKMQDVIFAGSSTFKPMGMAHVSVTVDNRNRILPTDYDEVMITRRLMRSGESEYQINKKPCRLRDIQNLFLGTGVGKSSYSVLAQGKIADIIKAKPADRRYLVEEAAGISKYKARRQEAQRKLERTDIDLSRLNDLLGEVGRQVNSLKRQAAKAERYRTLVEEGTQAEQQLLVVRAGQMRGQAREVNARMLDLRCRLASFQTTLARKSAEEEAARDAEELLRDRVSDETQTINDLRQSLRECEGQLQMLGAQINNNNRRVEQIEEEFVSLDARAGDIRLHIEEAEDKQKNAQASREQHETEHARLKQRFNELVELGRERTEKIESLTREVSEMTQIVSRVANEINQAKYLIETQTNSREEAQALITALEEAQLQEMENFESLQKSTTELNETVETLGAELTETRQRYQKAQGLLGELIKELQEVNRQLHSSQSRLETLEELKSSYEGYYQGVREVMQAADRNELHGVIGVAPNLIHTSEKYELAIEIALATHIQDIVVERAGDGKAALNYLRDNRKGRATLLPLDRIQPSTLNHHQQQALGQRGVIGLASDLVQYDPKISRAVDFLLGSTIVVEDLDVALDLGRDGIRARYVSLDGQLVNPSGAMTGGGVRASGLMTREREIRDLQESVARCNEKSEKMREEIERTQIELNTAHSQIEARQSSYDQKKLEQAEMKKDLEAAQRSLTESERRLEERLEQIRKIDGDVEEKRRKLEEWTTQLAEHEAQKLAAEEALEAERTAAREQGNEAVELGTRVATAEVEAQKATEQIREAESQIVSRRRELEEVERQRGTRNNEVEQLRRDSEQREQQMERIKNEISSDIAEREELEKRLTVDQDEHRQLEVQIKQLKADLDVLRRDERELDNEKHTLDVKIHELQLGLKNISAESQEKFEFGLSRLCREVGEVERDQRELASFVADYRRKLGNIGPVNMDALEAYEKEKERFEFLNGQHEDLTEAKQQLQETIAKLDETTRKLFHETFTSVREHFIETFRRLFNGGKADLFLEAEDGVDPLLDGGIEIVAQPPGKKLQTISLLSGGEQAMTAVSLLFALFLHKPAPFCFLDEIDAPLDDNNVKRFCNMLREFEVNTQFIIITHNKLTMELGDTIYGVTMEESGVSKLVSVRFDEAEELVDVATSA